MMNHRIGVRWWWLISFTMYTLSEHSVLRLDWTDSDQMFWDSHLSVTQQEFRVWFRVCWTCFLEQAPEHKIVNHKFKKAEDSKKHLNIYQLFAVAENSGLVLRLQGVRSVFLIFRAYWELVLKLLLQVVLHNPGMLNDITGCVVKCIKSCGDQKGDAVVCRRDRV